MACIFRRKVPSSLEVLMVMDKTIVMGAQADPELPKTWDDAHHKTIGNMYEAGDSFAMEVGWNNGLYLQTPGALKP